MPKTKKKKKAARRGPTISAAGKRIGRPPSKLKTKAAAKTAKAKKAAKKSRAGGARRQPAVSFDGFVQLAVDAAKIFLQQTDKMIYQLGEIADALQPDLSPQDAVAQAPAPVAEELASEPSPS